MSESYNCLLPATILLFGTREAGQGFQTLFANYGRPLNRRVGG
jgi:hypothetical protein